ncbi:MAG: nucleoside 2-deoxyribosyltransferase [Actinomycetota bacterium]|nr:nucleoside 2-deoxyribosyltransferase [Rubrobacteraceae bacterium]MBA3634878.1 nucleoside 2-deoxyribosyltransferase [Rubrobacteraceae bacterium]MDQ3499302.1 nucleoside 2-deoxyribosyltransferase [Actinomycetota bacterium]
MLQPQAHTEAGSPWLPCVSPATRRRRARQTALRHDDSRGQRHAMFHLDRARILDSDVFLFVLDGRVPDEGACVELGIAYCQKYLQNNEKLLVGLHTDTRAAFIGGRLNPMVRVPLDYVVDDVESLLRLLAGHGSGAEDGTERPRE